MTKTILLGMTAEEIVEKLKYASPQEIFEFKKLISSMDNYEEIDEAICKAMMEKVKQEFFEMVDCTEEDEYEEDLSEGEKELLTSILRVILPTQMTKTEPTLTEKLKAQLEPKKSLADVFREKMEPKKTLTEQLKEQLEPKKSLKEILEEQLTTNKAKTNTIRKEEILEEILEEIIAIELESDFTIIPDENSSMLLYIGVMFAEKCMEYGVQYKIGDEDVVHIINSLINKLIETGRRFYLELEDEKLYGTIR